MVENKTGSLRASAITNVQFDLMQFNTISIHSFNVILIFETWRLKYLNVERIERMQGKKKG